MRQVSVVTALILFAVAGCKSAPKSSAPATSAPPAAHAETKAEAKAPAAKDEKKAAPADAAKLECAHKADNRVLEVRDKDKGCELAYTKNGQEAVVSTSKNGRKHCQDSLDKIKDKLVTAGFTCK